MLVFVVLKWDDQSLSIAKDSVLKFLLMHLYTASPLLPTPPPPIPLLQL